MYKKKIKEPVKPYFSLSEPKEIIEDFVDINVTKEVMKFADEYDDEGVMSLKDFLKQLEEYAIANNLVDLYVSSIYEDDCCHANHILFQYKKSTKNKNFKSEMKNYLSKKNEYEIALKKYNEEMKLFEEQKKNSQKSNIESQIKNLQKQLNKIIKQEK